MTGNMVAFMTGATYDTLPLLTRTFFFTHASFCCLACPPPLVFLPQADFDAVFVGRWKFHPFRWPCAR